MAAMPDDIREHNRQLIEQFRANGRRLEGRPLLLLTTIGRRSGNAYTTPMMYVRLEDRLLVIASNAGAPKHPQWYLNLVANPSVTVELDGEAYEATATPAQGEERDRLFAQIAALYSFFNDHQAQIERRIPVVVLERKN